MGSGTSEIPSAGSSDLTVIGVAVSGGIAATMGSGGFDLYDAMVGAILMLPLLSIRLAPLDGWHRFAVAGLWALCLTFIAAGLATLYYLWPEFVKSCGESESPCQPITKLVGSWQIDNNWHNFLTGSDFFLIVPGFWLGMSITFFIIFSFWVWFTKRYLKLTEKLVEANRPSVDDFVHNQDIRPTLALAESGKEFKMTDSTRNRPASIDAGKLPDQFPTHGHDPKFWEAFGRTVATFGFLEEILGKAIFAFTGMQKAPADMVDTALKEWEKTLERALYDPLGKLIDLYSKAVRDYPDAAMDDFDAFIEDLRTASQYRNVLCHGSWQAPDDAGRSVPLFVNQKQEIFDGSFDIQSLEQIQKHASGMAVAVMNSVTRMGWQFPGSDGPGSSIAA